MPVGTPPKGGPLGRSRSRLSASGLTTYLRCTRQWYLTRKVGISSPKSIGQVLGIVIEDALCNVMMNRPGPMESIDELREWAYELADQEAQNAWDTGLETWENSLWKRADSDWSTVDVQDFQNKLYNGLELFLEEIQRCYDAKGGPYLEQFRTGIEPYEIPTPKIGSKPHFPVPEKVRSLHARDWNSEHPFEWMDAESPVQWNEAWEVARPWFKDPRVHQPQRMFHPEGWAAGELDLVLRWDGNIRLVDIKSGHSGGRFSESLQHQLRFYAWLWERTHELKHVQNMEGWYLSSKERILYQAPSKEELTSMDEEFFSINNIMRTMGEGASILPAIEESEEPDTTHACDGESAGCGWCSLTHSNMESAGPMDEELRARMIEGNSISSPCVPLSEIPSRVNVSGNLIAQWGPLPNHFNEPVLGAMLRAGEATIAIEEAEPGAFPHLHDSEQNDVIIENALPGVWRDQPRLYVDHNSNIRVRDEDEPKGTRIGLLRTRANVEGVVVAIRQQNGVRLDAKPWSMLSFHLWDGEHIVEVVAFGSAISERLRSMRPGNRIRLIGAELGWRAGLIQLRIDVRKTRIEHQTPAFTTKSI